jgi:pimeloyl-ACP methyl ester carboxylesterase
MPKIKVNGVNLHYITVGSGPDVVMLHGFLGNLALWHLYMVPLLRREFRVTTYDLRGHGYSEMTPNGYTPADMAEDMRCLLDTLGIQQAHLVGHSYGADVCMYFSLLHPERVLKLVAMEPGLAALVHQRKDRDWLGWSAWVEKLQEVGLQVPEDKKSDPDYLLQLSLETPKFYGPTRGLPRNRGPLLKLLRTTTLMQDYEYVGQLTLEAVKRIYTRTMLIYGHQSHFLSSYDYIHQALPNCESVLLPGGEHFGPLEQPELLTEHLLRFLREPVESDSLAQAPPECESRVLERAADD